MCSNQVKLSEAGAVIKAKPLTPTAPPEYLFDTEVKRQEPSAPVDYLVGIRPDWLPLTITLEEITQTYLITESLMPFIKTCMESSTETVGEKKCVKCNEVSGENDKENEPLNDNQQNKRKRCDSDISLLENDCELHSENNTADPNSAENSIVKISKNRLKKRKLIKRMSYTAWAIAFPVMVGINLLRGNLNNFDEEDKRDDPLRPWNYDVKYVQPHKR